MKALLALGFIAYPILFYLLHDRVGATWTIVLFGALATARILMLPQLKTRQRLLAAAGVTGFCLAAWVLYPLNGDVSGEPFNLVKLYPVFISAAASGYCIWTLVNPPSAAERIARAAGVAVPAERGRYIRGVTRLWCGFFIVNGSIAGYTALHASTKTWALYNGVISYVLIATLFAAEYTFRLWYRRMLQS